MTELLEEKIKELYGSKAYFCHQQGYKYKDFASKLRTFENRANWLNEFLKPLNLELQIAPKGEIGEEKRKEKD
jgi:hypothetical protein